jgi:hypothetical protein
MSHHNLLPFVYNLSQIAEFNEVIKDTKCVLNKLNITDFATDLKNEVFRIVKYNKNMLNNDNIPTCGLFRSVVVNSDNKVVSFSPPKSINTDLFIQNHDSDKFQSLVAEEFVEGTMINVFWDYKNTLWEFSTRSTVGAQSAFFKTQNAKTFRAMFLEAASHNKLDLNALDKNLCYSFVLQHPENRIVVPFKQPQLYLISTYMIDNEDQSNIKVCVVDRADFFTHHPNTTVKMPTTYNFSTYTDIILKYASMSTSYDILGVTIYNNNTGERTKIRNPVYEQVKQLRGNQPKLQYQYLCLRKEGKVGDFLKYFPEYKKDFASFRDQLHLFTNTLFANYISCYIKKAKPLIEFPDQYRTHMFNIHKLFLNDLKEQKLYVTNTVVIKYVNNIHQSLLMFCLNFQLRKHNVDLKK